jgi:hypothetical protein
MFQSFLKIMGIATGIAWGLLAVPLYFLAESRVVWGMVVGWGVAALCFSAGFYALCRYFRHSLEALMITVFGGMLARLLFIGTVFVLLAKLTTIHRVSFVSSLMGFYVLYLIIELYFVNTRLQSQEGYYS